MIDVDVLIYFYYNKLKYQHLSLTLSGVLKILFAVTSVTDQDE
jgi:hypothetical protein